MFEKYILQPFWNSIESFSDHNSFYINSHYYTYCELSETVSKIRIGIRRFKLIGKNIGLVVNDDLETYASIFAIWLEGFSYVPLHPHHPIERGREIIEQAGIELIIDSGEDTVFSSSGIIKSKELIFEELIKNYVDCDDSELAYILFTSGSTGKPKGVPITRGNISSFMKAFWESGIKIDENDRCLQCFDLTFDVSVQSFLVPLVKGACTYTIPHDQIKPAYAAELLEDHKLTFGAMAPSMLRFLRPYFDEIDLPDIRYNILTAEASPLDLVEEWWACIPNAEVYDFYGPTEATIYCTYYKLTKKGNIKSLNGMLSIGKALNGITAVIVDEKNNVLDSNIKGELCVSGNQITPGYWNNIEKNESSFFNMKISGEELRFYRTGDLCYFDDEGDLMYSGRIDHQIKIQGFRVELGEIEHHARVYLNRKDAVAVAYESTSGLYEIALFVQDAHQKKADLLEYLKTKIPYYMIPSQILYVTGFPVNANGKTDRNQLIKTIKQN